MATEVASLPRISLVTPSYNQGHFLEQTIDSVLGQGYPNLEYIIVDGGSTDSSVEVIRKHARHLCYWVSEPDSGQSDALIKGFARSTGILMNWINADDLLRPGALAAVAQAWIEDHAALIVGEDDQFTTACDIPVGHFVPAGYQFPDCLRFWSGDFRYHQPPTFFSRVAYEAVGGLRPDLHYVMDFDLYTRMLAIPGTRVHYLKQVLSAFRLHPAAKTARAKSKFLDELRLVSRGLWPTNWDRAAEESEMNRYCAECSVFQAVESFRGRDLMGCATALVSAARLDLRHSMSFALGQFRERNNA
jgi:glycosyltransferase involved in cell wall biosynthesis